MKLGGELTPRIKMISMAEHFHPLIATHRTLSRSFVLESPEQITLSVGWVSVSGGRAATPASPGGHKPPHCLA